MSTLVRPTGYTGQELGLVGGRLAFTLSNGNVLAVVRDTNQASGTAGDKTGVERVYVYESTNRSVNSWTLKANFTFPTGGGAGRLTAALFSDNSLGIVHIGGDKKHIYYRKMTYGTSALSAWETVATAAGNDLFDRADIAVSDTNCPVIASMRYDYVSATSETELVNLHVRRTDTNVWVANMVTIDTGKAGDYVSTFGLSLCVMGGSVTARNVVVALAAGNKTTDTGIQIRCGVINETTGADVGTKFAVTRRAGYMSGEVLAPGKAQGREVKLFRSDTNEYVMAAAHSDVNKTFGATVGTWDGTTWTETIPLKTGTSGFSVANLGDRNMAITYGTDAINFYYCALNVSGATRRQIINYALRINRDDKTMRGSPGHHKWNNLAPTNADTYSPLGGGDRNFSFAKHDTVFINSYNASNQNFQHSCAVMAAAPVLVTPVSGSMVTTSRPNLSANLTSDRTWAKAQVKLRWQFATNSSFTTNLIDYLQDDSKFYTIDGANVSTGFVRSNDVLSNLYTLSQSTWYVRSAEVDELNNQGPWSTAYQFTVAHPPSASNLSPTAGVLMAYGDGTVLFSWKFNDAFTGDSQTAFQIIVENNTTGAVLIDTGKIVSTKSSYSMVLDATFRDVPLRWRVRLWDQDGAMGGYPSFSLFTLADPPTVSIGAPTSGQVVSSGVPLVTFTPTVGGSRRIVSYVVNITQGSTIVWTSGTKTVSLVSGTEVTVTADRAYLKNRQNYTVQVTVTDETGLRGVSAWRQFNTVWVTPASPVGLASSLAGYNLPDQGFMTIVWADTGRDADFDSWIIYRKADEVDTTTGAIIEEGDWVEIYRESNPVSTGYTYHDYLAPSNHLVSYRVTQNVNRFGDMVESETTTFVSSTPKSEGYWLVEPVLMTAYKLSIVTSDSYTEEYEESEYTVIGRGRHVDRGQNLGQTGSLEVQLRDSEGMSARQKKRRLEEIKDTAVALYLRNPFGDVFRVSVGNIGISRIAGVGASEFVDVTLPYSEVSE